MDPELDNAGVYCIYFNYLCLFWFFVKCYMIIQIQIRSLIMLGKGQT